MPRLRRRLAWLVSCLAAAAFVLVVFRLNFSIFQPVAFPPAQPAQLGLSAMSVIDVHTGDGLTLTAWFAPPREKDGRIVVHFHGNAGNLANAALGASEFLDRGLGLMLCEYRGYSGNPGRPSEEGLYADARACLSWLKSEGYQEAQLALYGFSLGTAVAVQMATEFTAPLLVLEAPFSHIQDVVDPLYAGLPLHLLLSERFDSLSKIGRTKSRLLVVHGGRDELIDVAAARRLFAAAPEPKEFRLIAAAGHNDLLAYGSAAAIAGWIAQGGTLHVNQ